MELVQFSSWIARLTGIFELSLPSLNQCYLRMLVPLYRSCLVLHLLLHFPLHLGKAVGGWCPFEPRPLFWMLTLWGLPVNLSGLLFLLLESCSTRENSLLILQLNEVLMPNPFDRPCAVFMLEIDGVEDTQLGLGPDGDVFSRALKSRVSLGQNDVDIQFPDEELSLVSLNEPLPSYMEWTNKDLMDFASWLGGSYVSTTPEPLSGELIIPLVDGVQLKLCMSKKADREYTTSLISLIYNVKRAVQMHEDLSGSMDSPAELIKGRFDGVKALQEQYGTDDIVQQGVELLVTSLSKIYDSLQTAYKGQIVGVVLLNGSPSKKSETMLTVTFTSRPSRWLEETKGMPDSIKIAEVVLVRRTLAWITGIILIISTLLGIHFLMNMPLTRDTLLYSNVKLD